MLSARNRRSDAESVIWPQVLLVVAVVALTLIGFVMIYSASQVTILSGGRHELLCRHRGGSVPARYHFIFGLHRTAKPFGEAHQPVHLLSGRHRHRRGYLVHAPAQWLEGRHRQRLLGVCVALLVITFLFGAAALGAQRWIVIGPFSLQPSEFAKIAIVLMAANLMDDLNEGAEFNATMLRAAIYVAAPTLFFAVHAIGPGNHHHHLRGRIRGAVVRRRSR